MLDSGVQISVIREGFVSPTDKINTNKQIVFKGINNYLLKTIGEISTSILNHPCILQVVPDTINVPFHGILGSEFFTKHECKLNYETKGIVITGIFFFFSENQKHYTLLNN